MATLNLAQFASTAAPSSYVPNAVLLPPQQVDNLTPTSGVQNATLLATTTLVRVCADVAVQVGTLRIPADAVEYFAVAPGSSLSYKLA